MFKQKFANLPKHGVRYPEDNVDALFNEHHKELDLTPSVARELALLAELVGWTAFVPILLDIASRPDVCTITYCTWTWKCSFHFRHVWGGVKALKVLSSESKSLSTLCVRTQH